MPKKSKPPETAKGKARRAKAKAKSSRDPLPTVSPPVPTAPEPSLTDDWTDRQRMFVDAYTEYGSRSFLNGAEAARRAGYAPKAARQIAYAELTKAYIRAEIDRRLNQFSLGSAEVLARLAEHARNQAGAYVIIGKNNKPAINVAAMIRDGKQHLIKGISYTRSGDVVVETYDAQAALVHLGRYHKLFAERVEHAGTGGGPIQVEDINETREKRWQKLAPVLGQALQQGDADADGEVSGLPEMKNA